MRFVFTLVISAILAGGATAGVVVADFENFGLPVGGYLNDAGPSGFFESGEQRFNNSYGVDPYYGPYWAGWAVSTMTAGTVAGYGNQYSAKPGSGAGGSAGYGVAFTYAGDVDPLAPDFSFVELGPGQTPLSIDIANTAYTYYSMKDGDAFTRAFGARDYYKLTITGYDGGDMIGAVEVYLADYRDGKSEILASWLRVDLTMLAGSTRLQFGVFSTVYDEMFGISTPAYFAADNLRMRIRAVPEPSGVALALIGCVAFGLGRVRRDWRGGFSGTRSVSVRR